MFQWPSFQYLGNIVTGTQVARDFWYNPGGLIGSGSCGAEGINQSVAPRNMPVVASDSLGDLAIGEPVTFQPTRATDAVPFFDIISSSTRTLLEAIPRDLLPCIHDHYTARGVAVAQILPLGTQLYEAIENGNLSSVISLTDHSDKALSINRFHPTENKTPLYCAARKGDPEIVLRLINSGAVLNLQDPETARTALHAASYFDRTECLALLLAAGADPTITNYLGETARAEASGLSPMIFNLYGYGPETLEKQFTIIKRLRIKPWSLETDDNMDLDFDYEYDQELQQILEIDLVMNRMS